LSGPVTSVTRVEDVQIFLKDPVLHTLYRPEVDFISCANFNIDHLKELELNN